MFAWGVARSEDSSTALRVLVVSTGNAAPYTEVLRGFEHHWRGGSPERIVEVVYLNESGTPEKTTTDRVIGGNPDFVVTLGVAATRTALRVITDRPVIATLIANEAEIETPANATGVILDHPVELQLQTVKRVLPDTRKLGVLYSSERNIHRIKKAKKIAKRLGMKVYAVEVPEPKELPEALASIMREVDVLWGLPDPLVLNPQTAKTVLMTSLLEQVPFVGPSAAWAKAGALFALDWDYEDLGIQCSEMVQRLEGGLDVSALVAERSRSNEFAINLKSAEWLRVEIPEAERQEAQIVYR